MTDDTHPRPGPTSAAHHAVADLLSRRHELSSVFQPIQELRRGGVIGYEALLRLPAGTGLVGASDAFAAAGTDALVDLEIAALETHLRAARDLRPGRLFVSLSSRAFADERMGREYLVGLVRAAGFAPSRVVLDYNEQDREAGGISSVDRQGTPPRFGLLSLSIGIVTWHGEPGIGYRRLVEIAAEVKAAAKRIPGPVVVSNARDLTSGPWLPAALGPRD